MLSEFEKQLIVELAYKEASMQKEALFGAAVRGFGKTVGAVGKSVGDNQLISGANNIISHGYGLDHALAKGDQKLKGMFSRKPAAPAVMPAPTTVSSSSASVATGPIDLRRKGPASSSKSPVLTRYQSGPSSPAAPVTPSSIKAKPSIANQPSGGMVQAPQRATNSPIDLRRKGNQVPAGNRAKVNTYKEPEKLSPQKVLEDVKKQPASSGTQAPPTPSSTPQQGSTNTAGMVAAGGVALGSAAYGVTQGIKANNAAAMAADVAGKAKRFGIAAAGIGGVGAVAGGAALLGAGSKNNIEEERR